MIIWNFIRGLFCGNKDNNIIPEPEYYIKEEQLTQREYIKEEQQNEGEKKSIEDEFSENSQENNQRTKQKVESRLPEDQFLCSKCSLIPEILNIKSNEGKISFICHKHKKKDISVNEYINSIRDSTYFYLNNKCRMCGGKPTGIKTKMKYCLKCKKPICMKHYPLIEMKHNEEGFLINISEKNNICSEHPYEKAETYCIDCEEVICKNDKNHPYHNKINTNNMQNEANKYRKIIKEKNKKLYSFLRFYRMVLSSGNEEAKKQLEESIKNEKEKDDNEIDLAIYYLKQKENYNKNKINIIS